MKLHIRRVQKQIKYLNIKQFLNICAGCFFKKFNWGGFTYTDVYKQKKTHTLNIFHGKDECEIQGDTKRNTEKYLDLSECRHDLQAVEHRLPLNFLPLWALLS